MNLTDNARRVLKARYLRHETPEQMVQRVARAVAEPGKHYDGIDRTEDYRTMLDALDFLPNSPTLMNAGIEHGQLSACFVLPIGDTMEDIFEAVKRMALIQRTGGGTGFSFSQLRPRGECLASNGGEASGPVSFLRIFDCATANIKQGGKRRGANMGILRVDHPDIQEFIALKSDQHSAQNFNLSVGVTDEFMHAVEGDADFNLAHTTRHRTVRAREVLDAIVHAAWSTGDPGLVFLDTINRSNPTPQLGPIEATNPCGEVPLLPNEACNLGSINLAHMLAAHEDCAVVNWNKLRHTVHLAVRFLDDVIDASTFPFPEITAIVRGNRKIGLGVMGFADMLIMLGMSYDSDEAVAFAEELMRFIAREAAMASEALAKTRGVFPNWRGSLCETQGLRVRNATRTAIAPTGSIGIIADASAGIEPLFALAYRRRHTLGGEPMTEVNPMFIKLAPAPAPPISERGTLQGVTGVPEATRRLFVTAHEITPERHLQMQAAFQRHVDNSVSKTINLPSQATPDDVRSIYHRAWLLGLKGITVYRDGCRSEQTLMLGDEPEGSCLTRC